MALPAWRRARVRLSRPALLGLAREYDSAYRRTGCFRLEGRLKKAISARRRAGRPFLTRATLEALARWKSPRILPLIRRNSRIALAGAERKTARAQAEAERVAQLLALHGVGLPMASVILHFGAPSRYPIFDAYVLAALRRLGVRDRFPASPAGWARFCARIRDLGRRHRVSLRTLDKALWLLGARSRLRGEHGREGSARVLAAGGQGQGPAQAGHPRGGGR